LKDAIFFVVIDTEDGKGVKMEPTFPNEQQTPISQNDKVSNSAAKKKITNESSSNVRDLAPKLTFQSEKFSDT
jgi:hypothetical protein